MQRHETHRNGNTDPPGVVFSHSTQQGIEKKKRFVHFLAVTAMPVAAWTTTGGGAERARPEERVFAFSWYTGPLSAAGHSVVMRKIGERWYVRSFVRTWVS